MSDAIIQIENLVKTFDGRAVLKDVTISVNKGETMVIMGPSGCGKSTLLRSILALEKPDAGKIVIRDKEITSMNEDELETIRGTLGTLFQSGALFNSMTVGENVAFPLRVHAKLDEKIISIIIKMKLELVGLTGFEDLKPAQISGGMKKRVGLARAMALDPDIIFCDEPGAGLDPVTAAVIDQLIMDLSKKLGITFVVVTHEMTSAFRIADRMAMLYNGEVIDSGTPEEIRKSKNKILQQFVSGSADGPIPLKRSSEEYLKDLMGE